MNGLRQTLLIGNGLNRCSDSNIAWGDLLKDIAEEYVVEPGPDGVSFPLQFEAIVNQIIDEGKNKTSDPYVEIKHSITDKIKKATLGSDTVHSSFTTIIGLDTILTTNYDQLLELTVDKDYDVKKETESVRQDKYSLRVNPHHAGGKEFYHIHGFQEYDKSICLGYEHYAGMLQKLRSDVQRGKARSVVERLMAGETISDEGKILKLSSWPYRFFTDDMYIVGLGLYESEIDLWWLLTYRAFLYYNHKDLIRNRIVFYQLGDKSLGSENMQYRLKHLHVDYEYRQVKDKNWSEDYRKIAAEIAERIQMVTAHAAK